MEDNLVLKEEQIYVPRDKELRTEIIQLYYDVPVAKYSGQWKTTELVTRNYWWLEVTRDVEMAAICVKG